MRRSTVQLPLSTAPQLARPPRGVPVPIARTFALLEQAPNDPTLNSILTQLDYIKRLTAGGREPTLDERTSTRIGVRLLREFEPAQTDEIEDWANVCGEVEAYFRDWLDDATFQTIDEDDLPDFF